jgi:pimeloyl-ACP methyl ester carboxylesterase
MRETVVLVHGIWMTGLELRPLGARLRRHGYQVCYFFYPSLRHAPADNAQRLRNYLRDLEASTVHLVAHSLGGIVLSHLFTGQPPRQPGRVVMLGTPLQGSIVARHLYSKPALRWLLGRATRQGLLGDAPPWRASRETGMLAGTRPTGIGRLLAPGKLSGPHDGTVLVAETCSSALHEHRTVHHSHLEMLFSREVADLVGRFLQQGRFS